MRYNIYFSDHPAMPASGEFRSKAEARAAGNRYIRAWRLDAVILRIEAAPKKPDKNQ